MEPIQVVEYLGYTINIFIDEDPVNPRKEFDYLGKILYISSQYELGDKQVEQVEIEDIMKQEDVIYLPVYAYIHSGITLNTAPFNCKWDSGQCGIIYCELDAAKDEYAVIDPELNEEQLKDKVFEIFRAEVEEFSKYLSGEVYGFTITEPNGINEHSCWGFYSIDDCIKNAKSFADSNPIPQICMTFDGTPTCTSLGKDGASCGGR